MSAWIFEPRRRRVRAERARARAVGPKAQHGGAPAALLAREIERVTPGRGHARRAHHLRVPGPVPLLPLEADAWIQRPGARLPDRRGGAAPAGEGGRPRAGRPACAARRRASRTRRSARPRRRCEGRARRVPSPFPAQATGRAFTAPGWTSASRAARLRHRACARLVSLRASAGRGRARRARCSAWSRLPTSATASAGSSTSTGTSSSNTDLTVHLHRDAVGEWVLIDAATVADPVGAGLASSRIHDEAAPSASLRRPVRRRALSASACWSGRAGFLARRARLRAADLPVADHVDPPALHGREPVVRPPHADRAADQDAAPSPTSS